jgi:EAL domain-containing protein (putative c-di-GMP-specific phosphodiesterase class I)
VTNSLGHFDPAIYQHAIKSREFIFYYQPIVDGEDRVVSFEALMRWEHEGKLISPALFIPQLEKFKLLYELTEVLIEDVVQAFPLLLMRFENLKWISINIEPTQLLRSEFLEVIERIHEVSKCLAFEVTESMPMPQNTDVDKEIIKLKGIGAGLHLDDIDRGYSTLESLKNYDFDLGKIDRHVLVDALDEGDSKHMKDMVLGIHKAGRLVVVEGVENKYQLDFVREMSRELAVPVSIQGFYFSRPEPLDYWLEEKRVFERFR